MDPVRVPQHLELDDVVAWGLGAIDLVWAAAGIAAGWWLYTFVPAAFEIRIAAAAIPAATGLALGIIRLGEIPVRRWLALAIAFAIRPRLLVTG